MGITLISFDFRLLRSREHFSSTIENVLIVRVKILKSSRRVPFFIYGMMIMTMIMVEVIVLTCIRKIKPNNITSTKIYVVGRYF